MSESTFIQLVVCIGAIWIIAVWARWIWLQRPVVVWDECQGKWRAQRDMSRGRRG